MFSYQEFVAFKAVDLHAFQDLANCVDEDFPLGTELTKLQQQAEAHAAFAAARCRVYIGREEYFTTINSEREKGHIEPFVLLGESG